MVVKTFGNEVTIEEDAGVRVDQCVVEVESANVFQSIWSQIAKVLVGPKNQTHIPLGWRVLCFVAKSAKRTKKRSTGVFQLAL